MSTRLPNIGDIGARRRRTGGIVWLVLAIAAAAALIVLHEPRALRAVLVIPFALSAIGFLQARDKT